MKTRTAIMFGLLALATAGAQAADDQSKDQSSGGTMPMSGTDHAMGGMHGMATGSESSPSSQTAYALPAPTPAEVEDAFPDLGGMDLRAHMRTPLLAYLMADRLEWRNADGSGRGVWDLSGWVGRDFNRLWYRSEGEYSGGEFEAAEAHLLYGRAVARWWDLVVGLRQDFEPGPATSYAAVGVQGLAPYWFETQLTLYAGEAGQSAARLELDYELLFTNRLILQPRLELNAYGRGEPGRGIGAGLATAEAGLRLRYEIRREFAPYIGIGWERRFGNTADLAKADGADVQDASLLAGIRLWF